MSYSLSCAELSIHLPRPWMLLNPIVEKARCRSLQIGDERQNRTKRGNIAKALPFENDKAIANLGTIPE